MLNGAATAAVPVMLAPLVFCTTKARSSAAPVVTLPKLVAVGGGTAKSAWAAALGVAEPALSFPEESTGVRRAKYVVPADSPVTTVPPAWGDVIARNGVPPQAGALVPR